MVNALVWVLIVIVILVGIDKIITVVNIQTVEKNFPEMDKYDIEKNPVAKFFFKKCGLLWGTIIYGILSVLTFIIALLLIEWTLKLFGVVNAQSISLYIMILLYCLVIGNNLFFLLKFSKVVP